MTDILKRNNVKILGTGEQTILFAHGFGGDQTAWKHVYKAFTDRYRVVLLTTLGREIQIILLTNRSFTVRLPVFRTMFSMFVKLCSWSRSFMLAIR